MEHAYGAGVCFAFRCMAKDVNRCIRIFIWLEGGFLSASEHGGGVFLLWQRDFAGGGGRKILIFRERQLVSVRVDQGRVLFLVEDSFQIRAHPAGAFIAVVGIKRARLKDNLPQTTLRVHRHGQGLAAHAQGERLFPLTVCDRLRRRGEKGETVAVEETVQHKAQ